MGHESPIELWSPNLTMFCFAGFGTDRLRCQEAMKTAGRENPKRWGTEPRNRAHGAVGQNNSRSIVRAEKQENFQPREKCFFLTSSFIELIRLYRRCVTVASNILCGNISHDASIQLRARDPSARPRLCAFCARGLSSPHQLGRLASQFLHGRIYGRGPICSATSRRSLGKMAVAMHSTTSAA